MSTLPGFQPEDFAAYARHRQRDPEYNGYRLAVRRKLGVWGKHMAACLKKEGLSLSSRTSLERPYRFNAGRVNAQWAYLSRSPKEKKALVDRVGPALGQDVDTHYIQTTFVLSIDDEALEQALRIHALAWWDGQNLKNLCQSEEALHDLVELLNALPQGFVLYMDNWKKEYRCGSLHRQDLQAHFSRYTPGEHWWNLRRRLPMEVAVELGEDLPAFVEEGLQGLAPIYRFFAWSPDNDALFDEDGRIRK